MKWVKVAIGAVIAVMSIGIIATSVYDLARDKLVEPEILITYNIVDRGSTGYTRDIDVNVKSYIETNFDYLDNVTTDMYLILYNSEGLELVRRKVNYFELNSGSDHFIGLINSEVTQTYRFSDELTMIGNINTIGFWDGNDTSAGDKFELIIDSYVIPPQLTGINATLLLLTPLIFAGGVLTYLLNKQEL